MERQITPMQQRHQPSRQPTPKPGAWQEFTALRWFDSLLDFLFRLTAKSSEVLLALGVILATANHFQHGALFGRNAALFQVWTWTQAIGFEASAGVVLSMALDANSEGDRVKRSILLSLMIGLALVGTIMLVMALAEAATGLQEAQMPVWYGVMMAIFRGVVSVAYVTVGRVKNRRFSGSDVVPTAALPDVFAQFLTLGERLERIENTTEQQVRYSEANAERRMEAVTEQLRLFTEHDRHAASAITETLAFLPAIAAQLAQIEQMAQGQLRIVTEEVTQVKTSLAQQTLALPHLAENMVNSEQHRTRQQQQLSPFDTRVSVRTLPERTSHCSPKSAFEKGAFVRQCLTENPLVRSIDIQRKAADIGFTISPAYISETRKAYAEAQRIGEEQHDHKH